MIEVVALELGQPSAGLFDLRAPQGARMLTETEYEHAKCVNFGPCLASPRPEVTPQPAPSGGLALAAEELAELSAGAPVSLGGYKITIQSTSLDYNNSGTRTVVMFDGDKRYRIERTMQVGTVWEDTMVTLVGDGYAWISETQIDGTTIWRTSRRGPEDGIYYPLRLPTECTDGWVNVSVDLVAARVADHIECSSDADNDFWIDRATRLVVRTVFAGDPEAGTSIQEVLEIRLGPQVGVAWDLPEDAQ